MVYNQAIQARVDGIVSGWNNIGTRRMFGGICYLLQGNMFCGIYRDLLILRLGEKHSQEALQLPFVRDFDITGRPMKGWIMMEAEGFKTDIVLKSWLEKAKDFVGTLPAK